MINSFSGKYDFLSNFYPCMIHFESLFYPSSEHAFQAAKSLDPEIRINFTDSKLTPGKAKRQGRNLELRSDWEDVKIDIMKDIVTEKFFSYSVLQQLLLDTGDEELVEGNTWYDTFWGVCDGKGYNHLGVILMKVREELKCLF